MKRKKGVKGHITGKSAGSHRYSSVSEKSKTASRLRAGTLKSLSRELQAILDGVPDVITFHAPDLRILLVNRAARELLGKDEENIIGKYCYNLWHNRSKPCFVCPVQRSLKTGKEEIEEISMPHDRLWEIRSSPITDKHGKVTHVIEIGRDVTEEKIVEAGLIESEGKFRALAEASPVGIYLIQDGMFKYVNPAAARIFGYSVEEIVNKKRPRDVVLEQDQPTVEANIQKRISGEVKSMHYEFRGFTKKEEIINAEVYGSRTIYQGKPAIIGTVVDITEKKKAAKEKERMREQVFQLQKMEAIGLLAGGIAHDLNNLLTVIHGHAELGMMRPNADKPLRLDLEEILNASASGTNLTRQLLLFSRKHPMKLTPVNINTTVESMQNMLKRLIGENIIIETGHEPGLWNVMGDNGGIEQVIMNLMVNARDALSGGGTITIKTENVNLDEKRSREIPEARPGNFVRLTVADTGGGIDEADMLHIFEPFFTTKEKGTGLGLSVVYGIAKQHNGWVSACSKKGKGSSFVVYLPAVLSKHEETIIEAASLKNMSGRGERILIVEDEESTLDFIKAALGENGYTVFAAPTVREALMLFNRENGNLDLVFSDVVLPDGSGIELVEKISREKPGITFMLTSGYAEDKSHLPLIRARGYRFLQKPYTLYDLLAAVKNALERVTKIQM